MEQTVSKYRVQSPYRTRTVNKEQKQKILKYWEKFVFQTIASAAVLATVMCCKNIEMVVNSPLWENAVKIAQTDYTVEDIKLQVNKGLEFVGIVKTAEPVVSQEIIEETTERTTEPEVKEEPQEVVDPTANMSQEEKDIYNILASTSVLRPVNGELTSEFGARVDPITKKDGVHTGADFAVAVGTQVKSAISGTVVEVQYGNKSFGNFVRVKNSDIVTTYAHCSTLKVKEGDKVKQGDIIALSGNTGKSSGPHLHFEVSKDGRLVDPMKLV